MSSTKKKEKKSSVLKKHLAHRVAWLEADYFNLQKQFCALKERWEASHQTLDQIVTHMHDGLMFISLEGKITLFNPAASDLLECAATEISHSFYWDHFPDDLFGFSMREALKKPSLHQRLFLTLNESKEIDVSTSTIPDKGILLLFRSLNEQKKLEKGLNRAERLQDLGEMAATLAHEIRNPLGGIEGFAQLLKRDLEKTSHQQMVVAILEGTQALNDLVTGVLDYARPIHLHFATTDLVDLIRKTLFLLASSSMPTYTFQSAYERYPITIDQGLIKRVLLNLMRNASEANASCVEMHLTPEGAVIVKDNGEGITHTICTRSLPLFLPPKHVVLDWGWHTRSQSSKPTAVPSK